MIHNNKLTEREELLLLNRNFLYCDICNTKDKNKIYYIIKEKGDIETKLICESCKTLRNY